MEEIPIEVKANDDLFKRVTVKYIMAFFAYFYNKERNRPVEYAIRKIILQLSTITKDDKVLAKMQKEREIKRFQYPGKPPTKKKAETWDMFFNDFQKIKKVIK